MNFLNRNKWWILAGVLLGLAVFYAVRTIRYIRKKNTLLTTNNNIQAFLKMIRYAEGTAGPDGYKTLFGGKLFDSYATHPNVHVPYKNTYSTAAGAYQILYRTWLRFKIELNLKDFGPQSQDRIAIELIRENGGLDHVLAGRFSQAVDAVKKVWASLPGAGYNQPEKKLADLLKVYQQNGGFTA